MPQGLLSLKAVAPLLWTLLTHPVPAVIRAAFRHDKEKQQCCLSPPCSDGKEGTRDLHMRAGGLTLPSTYSGAVSLSMRSG